MAKKSDLMKVAEGLTLMEESRKELEALRDQYDNWIDEAAIIGDDEYSDQLIDDKLGLCEFISDLKKLEQTVRTEAIKAKTFKNLKSLPAAISACKSLLQAGPDLAKLGKDISNFKMKMRKASTNLSKLRSGLFEERKPTVDERISGVKKTISPEKQAEISAREARLQRRLESNRAPISAPLTAADTIDIDALIDNENRSKKPE